MSEIEILRELYAKMVVNYGEIEGDFDMLHSWKSAFRDARGKLAHLTPAPADLLRCPQCEAVLPADGFCMSCNHQWPASR
jgi:hypothetical protein